MSKYQRTPPSEAEAARRARFEHFMTDYYLARYTDLLAMEAATGGYPAEVAEYKAATPPMVFKRWLVESRGTPR